MPHILSLTNILAGFLMMAAAVDAFNHLDRPNYSGGAFWLILGVVAVVNGGRLWPA
jgi:hypothetical protein